MLLYGSAETSNVGSALEIELLSWDLDIFEVTYRFAADTLFSVVWTERQDKNDMLFLTVWTGG